jgi:transcriptional regulator with XRE-family HTH domain
MHSLLSQLIGKYISVERKSRGVTQRELARKVGCSEQFLGRIESGAVMIPGRILVTCIQLLSLKHEKLKKYYRKDADDRLNQIFNDVKPSKQR